MLLKSKWSSVCRTCGGHIAMGDRISWQPRYKGVEHAACSDEGKVIAEATKASRAATSDVTIPAPEGLSYLPYQRAGIAYALDRKGTIIADEMGLGKTIQAIGVINSDPTLKTVLIVCPASLKLNWRDELTKWLVRPATLTVTPGYLAFAPEDGLTVHITNYERLEDLKVLHWDLVIFDEAQKFKNAKKKGDKVAVKRTELVQNLARFCRRKVLLTGTPIENAPLDAWSLLQVADPETWDPASEYTNRKGERVKLGVGEGGGFMRYAMRYCAAHKEQHSRTASHWVFDGASNLEELNEKLRTTCMVRRLKRDVLTELPPKTRQVLTLEGGELEEEQRVWRESGFSFEDSIESMKSHQLAFEAIAKARKATAMRKIPHVVDYVRESLEADKSRKVIVFAHHRDVVLGILSRLDGYGAVIVHGMIGEEDRHSAVERFQNNAACRVFVGTIKAAGVGLTLTASSHVVFAEESWNPADVAQAEDRAHRFGQRDNVLVTHLVFDGSIDSNMLKVILRKQEVAEKALD